MDAGAGVIIGKIEFGPYSRAELFNQRYLDEACEIITDLIDAVNSGKEKNIIPEIERAEVFLSEMGRGKE